MNTRSSVADFFIYSNIYVAFPVTALCWETFLLNSEPPHFTLLAYIYTSTLFLYCFHRIFKLGKKIEPYYAQRHIWAINHRKLCIAITALAGFASLLLIYLLPLKIFIYMLPPAAIALGYSVPVVPWKGSWIRLRDIALIKIVLISTVVSYITILLPEILIESINEHTIYTYAGRFFFIMAITIPFDIRDVEYDKHNKLATIPTMLGAKKAAIISAVLLFAFSATVFVQYYLFQTYTVQQTYALLVSALLALVIILQADAKKSEYYYSLLVEGTMVFQFILVWLAV